jgi:uncharacterized protein with PQ loop repeat
MRGLHHVHLRKRKAAGLEPYPARSALKRFLDHLVLCVGIIGPLTAVPQILKIFLLQDASGVSLLSWLLPGLLDVPWIIYGLVHKERPIAVTYSLWFLANLTVAVGVLLYGGNGY